MEDKVKRTLTGVGFYGTLAVCLAVVGVCGWLLLRGGEETTEPELPVTPRSSTAQPVETPKKTTVPVVETLEPTPIQAEPPELPELEVDDTPVTAEAPGVTVEPLQGEVLTAFSMEELLYSPALGDWRTHDGIDIAAEEGAAVLAASAGTVSAVVRDPLMGTTVTVDHAEGYQTIYASLLAELPVEAGDTVAAGEVIGAVGATAAAEEDTPHLHFAVLKDGKSVDPREYLDR